MIECHISNVHRREEFGTIPTCRRPPPPCSPGFGIHGYALAIRHLAHLRAAKGDARADGLRTARTSDLPESRDMTTFMPIDPEADRPRGGQDVPGDRGRPLLQGRALQVHVRLGEPVYTDCRKIISYPRLRSALTDFAVSTIVREVGYESLTHIAGGETAGIPFAAWIADRLGLPMQYVRKKAKGFGRNAQIEGEVVKAPRRSSSRIWRRTGAARSTSVRPCATRAPRSITASCCSTTTSSPTAPTPEGDRHQAPRAHTWWDVLEVAKEMGTFDPATLKEVESFLHEPAAWSSAHGGISAFGQG